jgi:hypothetical protein
MPVTQLPPELTLLELALLELALLELALLELTLPPVPLDEVFPLVTVAPLLDELGSPPAPPPPLVPVPEPSVKSSSPRIVPHPLGASVRARDARTWRRSDRSFMGKQPSPVPGAEPVPHHRGNSPRWQARGRGAPAVPRRPTLRG